MLPGLQVIFVRNICCTRRGSSGYSGVQSAFWEATRNKFGALDASPSANNTGTVIEHGCVRI
jgi:hypothetical protein